MVQQVERFCSNLEGEPLAHLEPAGKRQVHIEISWPSQAEVTRISESTKRVRGVDAGIHVLILQTMGSIGIRRNAGCHVGPVQDAPCKGVVFSGGWVDRQT